MLIPTWFTASTFLCKDDHRKIVVGSNQHQVPFSNFLFIIFPFINRQIVRAVINACFYFVVSQVRLYDIASQKRAVISIDFREAPIKAVREDTDGHTVYVGTAIGDLASFDMRTGTCVSFAIPGC